MGRIVQIISLVRRNRLTSNAYIQDAEAFRYSRTIVCMLCIALGLIALPVGSIQAGPVEDEQIEKTDLRWLPWLGSWRLDSSTITTENRDNKSDFHLDVAVDKTGTAVIMKAIQGETVLYADRIVADGSSQPLKDEECTGSYAYSWSDTGKRLLFKSESKCPGISTRNISGLSVIDRNGEWIDIQLMQDPNERIITIRRYTASADKTKDDVRQRARTVRLTRLSAAAGFSIDEVIELSDKVPSEVLEAALIEVHQPFNINSKTLIRLADAGVSDPVIDLMVAISFPEKFYVERDTVSVMAKTDSGTTGSSYSYPPYVQYSMVDPYFPWYWTPSTYSLYWHSGWSIWPNIYYRYYPGGGSSGGGSGYEGRRDSGRLVAGRGYTRVESRDSSAPSQGAVSRSGAVSRTSSYNSRTAPAGTVYSSTGGSGSYSPPPSSSSSGSSSSGSYSSGGYSSGGSSGGSSSSGSSGGSSPSASPSGYSGGGGGGSAQPR